MRKIIPLYILILLSFNTSSQIVINEFLASNQTGITDNYGEYEDWIEIYNPTGSDYNLGGLFITDNLISPMLFQIPLGNDSTIVPAGGYLLLWADDDIEQGVLHLSFKLTGTGEQIGLYDGMGNPIDTISFGQQNGDVSMGRSPDGANNWVYYSESTPESSNLITYLSPLEIYINIPYSNNYIHTVDISSNVNWNISNTSSWLSITPLSGSNNGSITLTTTQENTTGADRNTTITLSGTGVNNQEIYVTQYAQTNISNLVINEFMAQNDFTIQDNFGEYDDWIEIYNQGSVAIDLGGLFITDKLNDPLKFQISNLYQDSTTIEPGGFLLFWADDDTEQGVFHLNFKLSNNGESIGLYQNEFAEIDLIDFDVQDSDISYGRIWDGGNTWQFFSLPTPGYSNSMDIEENTVTSIITYPNPALDYFMIETYDNYMKQMTLYNIYGNLVREATFSNLNKRINISDLATGLYVLKVISNNKIYVNKILIQ